MRIAGWTLVALLLPPGPASAGPVTGAGGICRIDVPDDWTVRTLGQSVDARSPGSDVSLALVKGYGSLAMGTAGWKPLVKVKATREDSATRWWAEIEPDAAHKGMRAYLVITGNASQSCNLSVHFAPALEASAAKVAQSLRLSR